MALQEVPKTRHDEAIQLLVKRISAAAFLAGGVLRERTIENMSFLELCRVLYLNGIQLNVVYPGSPPNCASPPADDDGWEVALGGKGRSPDDA